MIRAAQIVVLFLLFAAPAWVPVATAADMPGRTISIPEEGAQAALQSYLQRRAVLLQLRARFQVSGKQDIARVLAADAAGFAATGPTDQAEAWLRSDLLAEGSYYLVSLRYLIEGGGSLWPGDRSETTYVNDALAGLRQLQAELPELIESGSDPIDFFVRLDRINAWTEGYRVPPPDMDHFADRDQLVETALAGLAPVAI